MSLKIREDLVGDIMITSVVFDVKVGIPRLGGEVNKNHTIDNSPPLYSSRPKMISLEKYTIGRIHLYKVCTSIIANHTPNLTCPTHAHDAISVVNNTPNTKTCRRRPQQV